MAAIAAAACSDDTECQTEANMLPPCNDMCPQEQCFFTECVEDPVECEPLAVTCSTDAPNCPRGQTLSVRDQCWGDCVELR